MMGFASAPPILRAIPGIWQAMVGILAIARVARDGFHKSPTILRAAGCVMIDSIGFAALFSGSAIAVVLQLPNSDE